MLTLLFIMTALIPLWAQSGDEDPDEPLSPPENRDQVEVLLGALVLQLNVPCVRFNEIKKFLGEADPNDPQTFVKVAELLEEVKKAYKNAKEIVDALLGVPDLLSEDEKRNLEGMKEGIDDALGDTEEKEEDCGVEEEEKEQRVFVGEHFLTQSNACIAEGFGPLLRDATELLLVARALQIRKIPILDGVTLTILAIMLVVGGGFLARS